MPVAAKLFAGALGCAALFYVLLHPWSDMIGGALYWLIGPALPTLAVLLAAAGLAWLLPVGTVPRMVIAAVLTIPLGLNSSLAGIGDALSYKPDTSSDIRRQAAWPGAGTMSFAIKQRPWAALLVEPAGPQVQAGSNEGCGCMYFVDRRQALYSDVVIERLHRIVGRRATVTDYASLSQPGEEARDVHVDLNFFERNGAYRALVEVFDHGVKIAAFAHTNIPLRTRGDARGLGPERITANFWSNASDLLLHDNIWSDLLNRVAPGYFPEQAFRDFITASIARAP
jgi:hypothetical protein